MTLDIATADAPNTVPAYVRFSPEYMATHVGASQWPAAIGVDPYCEPIELFERFTGLVPWNDGEPNDAAELGHVLEDFVAKIAARRLGVTVAPCPTLEHPEHSWSIATPDRLVLEDGSSMQCKTTGLLNAHAAYAEQWGEEGTDEVPHRVLVQVTGEMMVLRDYARAHFPDVPICQHTHVAAFVGQRGVLLYRVEYDEELAQMLFGEVRRFWRCVETKTPPPLGASPAFTAFLGRRYPMHERGRWIEATDLLLSEAQTLKRVRAQIEELEATERAAKNAICSAIGDAEGIKGDFGKITWRGVQGREVLDTKHLLEELRRHSGNGFVDDLVRKHTVRGAGHRRFAMQFKKEATQ